jgi:hypothetical protein
MESNERNLEGEMLAGDEDTSRGSELRADEGDTSTLSRRPDQNGEFRGTDDNRRGRDKGSDDDDRWVDQVHPPLLSPEQREQLAGQWAQIQSGFVDRPRESVERADSLVVDVMQRVTSGFSREREGLEAQWEQGDSVSTEGLRTALTHYRSFFDRLLSA